MDLELVLTPFTLLPPQGTDHPGRELTSGKSHCCQGVPNSVGLLGRTQPKGSSQAQALMGRKRGYRSVGIRRLLQEYTKKGCARST